MKIKHALIGLTALTALQGVAQAADGTINFTGTITDVACTVDTNSASQTVNLGTVSSKAFTSSGSSAAPTRFGITLTNCPEAAANASVKFSGPANSANTSIIALTSGSDVATGVGVGIYEEDASTLIPLGTTSASKALSSTENTTLNFIAKYVATAASVGTGVANATSDFTIVYN